MLKITITNHARNRYLETHPKCSDPDGKLKSIYLKILDRYNTGKSCTVRGQEFGEYWCRDNNNVIVTNGNTIITYYKYIAEELLKAKNHPKQRILNIIRKKKKIKPIIGLKNTRQKENVMFNGLSDFQKWRRN